MVKKPAVKWEKWRLVGVDPDGSLHFHRDGSVDTVWNGIVTFDVHSRATVPAEIVNLIRQSALIGVA